jgi:hypothetical protein
MAGERQTRGRGGPRKAAAIMAATAGSVSVNLPRGAVNRGQAGQQIRIPAAGGGSVKRAGMPKPMLTAAAASREEARTLTSIVVPDSRGASPPIPNGPKAGAGWARVASKARTILTAPVGTRGAPNRAPAVVAQKGPAVRNGAARRASILPDLRVLSEASSQSASIRR